MNTGVSLTPEKVKRDRWESRKSIRRAGGDTVRRPFAEFWAILYIGELPLIWARVLWFTVIENPVLEKSELAGFGVKHRESHQTSSTKPFHVVVFLDHLENDLACRFNDKEQSGVWVGLDQLTPIISLYGDRRARSSRATVE